MRPVRVMGVVGARPNFMKMAPILHGMSDRNRFEPYLVHTGQHYDAALSDAFFTDLQMPDPDTHLEVGSGSHGAQTARILERFEPVVAQHRPDLVLVAGDVNSTVACSLAAVKLGVPVGHVEAGLRSGDRTMPEEINRIITDSISDLLFTTSRDADENLVHEGVDASTIRFVGNPMIDTLRRFESAAESSPALEDAGVARGEYALITLHRPSNVDSPEDLARILMLLEEIAGKLPTLFPIHPRTRHSLESQGRLGDLERIDGLTLLPPLGYLDFLALMASARIVLTDSGGVQEETTALGVACLTLRPNTERPVTVTEGTNLAVTDDPNALLGVAKRFLSGSIPLSGQIPEKWDGQAGKRIAQEIHSWFSRGGPSRVRSRPLDLGARPNGSA